MLFHSHLPGAPLRPFIEDIWLYEGYAGSHAFERILPSGTVELVFNLRDDQIRIYDLGDTGRGRRHAGAVVSGPYACPFLSDRAEEAAIMGVHFRPGGAGTILGLPAGELTGRHVDLAALWGAAAAASLRARLCAARRPADRFRILEDTLRRRLSARGQPHGAVHAGLRLLALSHGRMPVREVVRAVELSPRRFIALFAAAVGQTPKLFARIQRFQRAAALLQGDAQADGAQLALACGYFDQSHLVRDFREFSGASPAAFQRQHAAWQAAGTHVKRHHLPVAG